MTTPAKRPRTVRIGSQFIEIDVMEKELEELVDTPAHILVNKGVMRIGGWTHPEHQKRDSLHESLHGLFDLAGFTHSHDAAEQEVSDELEERIVARLAPLLLLFIRDNPRYVAWLQDNS